MYTNAQPFIPLFHTASECTIQYILVVHYFWPILATHQVQLVVPKPPWFRLYRTDHSRPAKCQTAYSWGFTCSSENGGTASCNRHSSFMKSSRMMSGLLASTWPALMNDGPSLIKISLQTQSTLVSNRDTFISVSKDADCCANMEIGEHWYRGLDHLILVWFEAQSSVHCNPSEYCLSEPSTRWPFT